MESTWQTLSAAGQQALAALSVVHAPCSLDAALAIAGHAQALAELFEMALVHHLDDGNVWIRDHVCRFAGKKLTSRFTDTFIDEAHRRHASWFLRWLGDSHHHLYDARGFPVRERLMSSLSDLEAAWHWALTHGEWNWVADAVFTYEDLHHLSGRSGDGLERIHRSLPYVNSPDQPSACRLRACLLIAYAGLQRYHHHRAEIEAMLREAADLAAHIADPLLQMLALIRLSLWRSAEGKYEEGRTTLTHVGALCAHQHASEATVDAMCIEIVNRRGVINLDDDSRRVVQAEDHACTALQVDIQIGSDFVASRGFETLSNAVSAPDRDRCDEAEGDLSQSLELYRHLRMVYQQARARRNVV